MQLITYGGAKIGRIYTPMQVPDWFDQVVSAAQLLALNATPRAVVPAPGPGFANVFAGALLDLAYNGAAYAGIAAGEDLAFKYTDAAGLQLGACETIGFLDATANAFRWVRPYVAAAGVSSIVPVENAAIVLHMLSGEVTTGNSPLKVRTYFYRVPTAF